MNISIFRALSTCLVRLTVLAFIILKSFTSAISSLHQMWWI